MRLIDADAFERELMLTGDDEICEDCCYNFVNLLASQPTVGGWISVKDRLPEKDQDVIIYGSWVGVSGTVYKETQFISMNEAIYKGFTPIAWMPLPQVPDVDEAHLESKDKPEAPVMAGSNVYSGIWLCPRCRSELTKITGTKTVFAGIPNYCPYCGQRLKLPNETVQVPEPE